MTNPLCGGTLNHPEFDTPKTSFRQPAVAEPDYNRGSSGVVWNGVAPHKIHLAMKPCVSLKRLQPLFRTGCAVVRVASGMAVCFRTRSTPQQEDLASTRHG